MSPLVADSPRMDPVQLAPETPCAHCGLPVGSRPILDGDEAFCCTGCSVVFQALASAGFGDTFYRLKALSRDRAATRPIEADHAQQAELDTSRFLEEQTTMTPDGQRSCTLFLDGVHCAACVWLVERMPYEVDGVHSARLDLPRARLTLTLAPETPLSTAATWLSRFGYVARPLREAAVGARTDAERALLVRMGVAWALAGNVMLVAFALYSGLTEYGGGLSTAAKWASLVLAIPAVGYGGAPFFQRAWGSVKVAVLARSLRHLHMDTPIALGIGVGFGQSAWATVSGNGDVWFDSITVLIAALLTARYLQLRSRRLAGEASERLLTLIPTMAQRLTPDGTPEWVRQDELRPDDLVRVAAGDVIPVDGTVQDGSSRIDNAVLTGEARPVPVDPGAAVVAGATNLLSPLTVRVQKAGAETRVGHLLAWVQDASSTRAPVVLLANRLSGVFVATVLGLATVTAFIWLLLDASMAAQHVAALLVISCPCALGMATPLAMSVAAGRAARAGLFIKSDEATQRLTEVDTVVLDKTGTLTEGRMALADWFGDTKALALAAALEAHAMHPIADAFVRESPPDGTLDVSAIEAVAGQGIRGQVAGQAVIVGNPSWVDRSCPLSADQHAAVARFAADGHTPVALAMDGTVRAIAAIGDRLRPEALALVDRLRQDGKRVHLLSGDHPDVVQSIAQQLGIPSEQAQGSVSPEGKKAAIERLEAEGRVVLMVGDGVNDAAALHAADVGVAVGGGTSASLVAADVFLTRPGLAPIAHLLDGAAASMRTIRWALGFSLAYNMLGAGAAMAGLITPLVAAIAMPVSSLTVVALALTQRSFRLLS